MELNRVPGAERQFVRCEAAIHDLSQDIERFDIFGAGYFLHSCARWWPAQTIFVAVVDPGVGTSRRILAAESGGRIFLAPDNGLLSWALDKERPTRVISVENERYFLSPKSRTFHGRDVFAPVAAALATGTEPAALGPTVPRMERLDVPRPVSAGDGLRGQVIYVDRFGNLTTNVTETDLRAFPRSDLCISIAEARLRGVAVSYGAVSRGQAVAVVNSWGLLEIAVRDGSAITSLGARVGDPVSVGRPQGAA